MKSIILALLIIALFSCNKQGNLIDDLDLAQAYIYSHTDIIDEPEYFDSLFKKMNEFSVINPDKFYLPKGLKHPHKKIIINEDGSVLYDYEYKETTYADNGNVVVRNDSLYFHIIQDSSIGRDCVGYLKEGNLHIIVYTYVIDLYDYSVFYNFFASYNIQEMAKFYLEDGRHIKQITIQKLNFIYNPSSE